MGFFFFPSAGFLFSPIIMQSYEAVGGYGVGDYYGLGMQENAYDATASSFTPKAPRGGAGFRGAGRGGGMRGGAMRGGAFGGGARGGSMRGGRGGMRGGAAVGGIGLRFNPMAAGGEGGFGKPAAPAGHIVFAYNIGPQTTENDVTELFSLYGTVVKVDVMWDFAKNMGKGYAFVTMPDYDEAAYAIQQLNGYNYAGKPLQVSFKSAKKS